MRVSIPSGSFLEKACSIKFKQPKNNNLCGNSIDSTTHKEAANYWNLREALCHVLSVHAKLCNHYLQNEMQREIFSLLKLLYLNVKQYFISRSK